ncbi:hypothetical protein FKM82_028760 [Ascaphus truei]
MDSTSSAGKPACPRQPFMTLAPPHRMSGLLLPRSSVPCCFLFCRQAWKVHCFQISPVPLPSVPCFFLFQAW